MFRDRKEAGMRLGEALERFAVRDPLVLAIPRGGAAVGYEAARRLGAEFSLLVSRKLPYPEQPEAGFGAVAEEGNPVVLRSAFWHVPLERIDRIIDEQRAEIRRRVDLLRNGEPLPPMKGRTVILVDDGLAMGSTMRAGIALCRMKEAREIVVAVPVAGERAAREVDRLVDETVVLEVPPDFRAVADSYERWYDVPDAEVIEIMRRARDLRDPRGRVGAGHRSAGLSERRAEQPPRRGSG